MKSVRVSTRGRITIPAQLRKNLGMKSGTKIFFEEKENKIIAHPVTPTHKKACKIFTK